MKHGHFLHFMMSINLILPAGRKGITVSWLIVLMIVGFTGCIPDVWADDGLSPRFELEHFFPELAVETKWLGKPLSGIELISTDDTSSQLLKRFLSYTDRQPVTPEFIRYNIQRLTLSGYCEDVMVGIRIENEGVILIFSCVPAFIITSVDVVGGYTRLPWLGPTTISRRDILDAIELRVGLPFNQSRLEQAVKTISKLFEDDGYFNCRVDITPTFDEAKRHVSLHIAIDRGLPARIIHYNIERQRVGVDTLYEIFKQARFNRWMLTRFHLEKFKEDLKKTEHYYRKFGYYSARVSIKSLDYDKETAEITMNLLIDPGPLLILDLDYHPKWWNFYWSIPWISDIRFLNAWLDFTPTELLPVLKRGILSERLLEKGAENITGLYQTKGYENVSVSVSTKKTNDGKGDKITYHIDEGEPVLVKKISINGAHALSPSTIKRSMRIKEKALTPIGRFANAIRGDLNGKFVSSEFQHDLKAIQSLYTTNGFRYCTVTGRAIDVDDNAVHLEVTIDEGTQTRIAQISFKGNTTYSDKELMKAISLRIGDTYLESDIEQDRVNLLMLYAKKGFLSTAAVESITIVPHIRFFDYGEKASISFEIAEHYQIWFDRPMVKGLTETNPKVVNREIDFRHHDPYNLVKILQTREQLMRLGIFKRITFEERPIVHPYFSKTVIWNLEERNTGSLDFGGGWNSVEGFRVFGTISERNFFNNGQYIGLQASVNQDATESDVRLLFRDRYLGNLPLELNTSIYRSFEQEEAFSVWSHGGVVSISRIFNFLYRGSFEYRLENIYGGQDHILLSEKDSIDRLPRRISSVMPRISLDTRDNPFLPQRGFLSNLQVEFARTTFGSELDFTKTSFLGTAYTKVFGQSVLVTNLAMGISRDLPIYERYRLGGPTTLRGYGPDSVGPVNSLDQPIFGNSMFLGNIEYRFPILWGLNGQIFYDIGNLWLEPFGEINDYAMISSVGFGIRFDFSFGPLRLDVGYPVEGHIIDKPVISFAIGHPF